jgi:toxin CptA
MLLIRLGPSRVLAASVVTMHVAAAWLCWLTLPAWPAAVALVALPGSLWFYLRHDCLRIAPGAVVALQIHPDCHCAMQTRDGAWLEASLLPTSFVAPYLTVLNLRLEGRRLPRHVTVLPDAVDGEVFRRMRVLLRWKCGRAT